MKQVNFFKKPTPTTLDQSSLQMIYDLCKLEQLIIMSQLDRHHGGNALIAIAHRFATKTIQIEINKGSMTQFRLTEGINRINIDDSEQLNILTPKHNIIHRFRGKITKISLCIEELHNNESPFPLLREINSKCSALTELDIYFFAGDNCFNMFEQPFENVLKLTLSGHFNSVNSAHRQFSAIFPALRILVINGLNGPDPAWATQHFNNLNEVMCGQLNSDRSISIDTFKTLIHNNDGIRRLLMNFHLVTKGYELLLFVNRQLPRLEHLVLMDYTVKLLQTHIFNLYIYKYLSTIILIKRCQRTPHLLDLRNLEHLYHPIKMVSHG